MTDRTILATPLMCREGQLEVSATGPVAREDWENLRDLIEVLIKQWPTLDEVRRGYVCACGWQGPAEKRVMIWKRGLVGCPACGLETRPVQPGAGAEGAEVAP